MKIFLKEIIIKNFKGIPELHLKFDKNESTIYGANASGKTSLVDAFLWVLVDKSSTGRTAFEIKPLDKSGNTKREIESSVTIIIEADGVETSLQKIYKEKWAKVRGQGEEFKGNETLYFWHNTPVKKEEYNKRLSMIVSNEEIFKILIDVKYFNSLTWEKKRAMIMNFVTIPDIKIEPKSLAEKLKNKSIEDLQAEIKKGKKDLLKRIDEFPVRIHEIKKYIVELPYTLEELEKQLQEIDSEIFTLNSTALPEKTQELYDRKNTIIEQINNILNDLKQSTREKLNNDLKEISAIDFEIQKTVNSISLNNDKIKNYTERIASIEKQLVAIRDNYIVINEREFNTTSCSSCNREYDKKKIKEFQEQFNLSKSQQLEETTKTGLALKEQQTNLIKEIDSVKLANDSLLKLKAKFEEQKKGFNLEEKKQKLNKQYLETIETHSIINNLNSETREIDAKLSKQTPIENKQEQHNLLQQKRDNIKTAMLQIKQNVENETRIAELEKEQSETAKSLTALEKTEFELGNYIKKRITEIELVLTKEFGGLEIKMFDKQVNGEIVETCVIQKDGVPFSGLNTASKIEVSLKLISVISEKMNIYLPVFIDNRESVTDLPKLEQQNISLEVDAETKKLSFQKQLPPHLVIVTDKTGNIKTKTSKNGKSSTINN
jgi:DNA repair exonuclease SbcCD ATPase subunit